MAGDMQVCVIGTLNEDDGKQNTIPIQNQSSLLRLPGEIRNKIYEYACAGLESREVHVHGFIGTYPSTPKHRLMSLIGLNPLRYVCRQLHNETRHMVLPRGDIILRGRMNYLVQDELYYPSFYWSTHIRKFIYISERESIGKRVLEYEIAGKLLRLAFTNPLTEVLLLQSNVQITSGCYKILSIGAAIQLSLRDQSLSIKMDHYFTLEVERMVAEMAAHGIGYRGITEEDDPAPSNFKVFPVDDYDEETLSYSYFRNKQGFHKWVAQVREWYEHGI